MITAASFDDCRAVCAISSVDSYCPVRTLDAIHLAVALTDARELAAGEPVSLVTRDKAQAAAAESLGLALG